MKIKKTLLVWISWAATGAVLWGDFEPTRWKFFKPIQSGGVSTRQLVAVLLDNDVLSNSERLERELRVVEGRASEVPFSLATDHDERGEEKKFEVTVLNRAVSGDRYQQFICDVGRAGQTTNQIVIDSPSRDFVRRADIEGSDDQKHWLSLAKGLHLFDWTEGRNLKLQFTEATYRYLKVILWLDGGRPIEVAGASVSRTLHRPGRLEAVTATLRSQTLITPEKFSEWIFDFGHSHPLVNRCTFQVESKNFRRRVELATSEDAAHWTPGPRSEIFRVTSENQGDEFVTLETNALHHRYLRIRVLHGDDRPLPVQRIEFRRFIRRLIFEFDPQKTYRLFFGNSAAPLPSYDLTAMSTSAPGDTLPQAALGSIQANPLFLDPRERQPWTERHPRLLWAVLIVIVVLLSVLMFKSVKAMGGKP